MPKLYHGQTPIWKQEGTNTYLYKKNDGGTSKNGRVYNMARGWWAIGEIIDGKEMTECAYCYSYSAAFDWCPHRVHYCMPNEKLYDVELMKTRNMKFGGI